MKIDKNSLPNPLAHIGSHELPESTVYRCVITGNYGIAPGTYRDEGEVKKCVMVFRDNNKSEVRTLDHLEEKVIKPMMRTLGLGTNPTEIADTHARHLAEQVKSILARYTADALSRQTAVPLTEGTKEVLDGIKSRFETISSLSDIVEQTRKVTELMQMTYRCLATEKKMYDDLRKSLDAELALVHDRWRVANKSQSAVKLLRYMLEAALFEDSPVTDPSALKIIERAKQRMKEDDAKAFDDLLNQ